MPRPLSQHNSDALRSIWRGQLLTLTPRIAGRARDLDDVAAALRVDLVRGLPGSEARLKRAAVDLRAALLTCVIAERDGDPFAELDQWIDLRLLSKGPDLIISGPSRQAALARHRNNASYRGRAEKGRFSARIDMNVEAWRKLRMIGAELTALTGKRFNLSQTIEHLISAHLMAAVLKESVTTTKKRLAKQTFSAPAPIADLFAGSIDQGPPRETGHIASDAADTVGNSPISVT